jgi:hypothetical protein
MAGQFGLIRGDAGEVTAAAGAKVGIISKWVISPKRMKPDGKPELQFKAQFSWKNDSLMAMVGRGDLRGRVMVTMRNNKTRGIENIDVVQWAEWRMEGGVLILEDIVHFEGTKFRPLARA